MKRCLAVIGASRVSECRQAFHKRSRADAPYALWKHCLKIAWTGILIAAVCFFITSQAQAHSFNVALLVPLSGPTQADGKAIRDGFLLATKERDSHPDEQSDGHLGGLDVYVYAADSHDADLTGLKSLLQRKTIEIIVPIGSNQSTDRVLLSIARADTILLAPGSLPYRFPLQSKASERLSKVTTFVAAFKKEYGYDPTTQAALGYNAARRIDAAVRVLGDVADKSGLKSALERTEHEFDW